MRTRLYDDIRDKISKGQFPWLLKKAVQYASIHLAFLAGRPLSGPILATLLTNYTCNYRCKMCDLPEKGEQLRKRGLKELSTSELKDALRDFADLGVSGIGFTGGEPLLRDDIFELMKYTKKLGMIAHLNTNGSLLNMERANKLLDCGTNSLNISLDGAKPETHDKIRGHKGAFHEAVNAITLVNQLRNKRQKPIKIKIVTVISEDNIDEIVDLISLSVKLGADYVDFIPEQNFKNPSISRDINSTNYSDSFFKSLDKVVEYLLKVKDVRVENSAQHLKLFKRSFKGEKSPLSCYAGYNSYGLDCFGLIYPCMPWFNWNRSVGNVRDTNLKDFWYSKKYNLTRKAIAKCKDCYLNCQFELNLLFNIIKK
jgi:MoaA/NifB/PqqE/SkfB family radical SAM enzyme